MAAAVVRSSGALSFLDGLWSFRASTVVVSSGCLNFLSSSFQQATNQGISKGLSPEGMNAKIRHEGVEPAS